MRNYGLVVVAALALVGLGADWPNFQGPSHNGISREKGLARSWPADGPREVWSVQLGQGFAAPVVEGGEVFLLDREGDQRDVMRCFDFNTGKQKWKRAFDAPGRLSYDGSRSSPAVAGDFVYAVGPFGDVYGINRRSGKAVWVVSLQEDYGSRPPRFGYGQSPLVYGDKLIVAPISGNEGLTALDRKTGDERWSSPALGRNTYASPMPVTIDGVKQITLLTEQQWAGVDPDSGKVLWSFGGYRQRNPIPNPTALGDGLFFITGGYNAGSLFVKVSRSGGQWQAVQVGDGIDLGSQIQPALLHDGYLYANINENGKMDRGLACLDLKGRIKWQTRNDPSVDRGSVIIADGMLISLGGQDGVLRLVELSPDGYNELASAKVLGGGEAAGGGGSGGGRRRGRGAGANMWAPLVLSDGKLLVRSQREMKCLDLRR